MPLDFPSNPSQDQEYEDYKYQVTYTAWLSDAEKTGFQQRIAAKENIVPAGTIHLYAGATAPTGFLLCQGQTVSRNTYPTLFAAIGTNYGAGDGATTFGIPDLRGRVAVGRATSGTFLTLNNRGGAETHTLSVAEMPSHTHVQDAHTHIQDSHTHTQVAHSHTTNVYTDESKMNNFAGNGAYTYYGQAPTSSATPTINNTTAVNQSTTATNQDAGGLAGVTQAHNNLQPYIVLNYIIKT